MRYVSAAGKIEKSPRFGLAVGYGLTLVELLVTMAIMAILLAIAVPSFLNASLNSKLNDIANSFVSSAQLARSEAIKTNLPVTLCASIDGEECGGDWADGWIVFWDNPLTDARVMPVLREALPQGFVLTGDATSIVFQPTGVGATSAALTVCRSAPSVGSVKREISVSGTGRTEVIRKSAATCP